MNRRVLISGSASGIGSALADRLRGDGDDVIGVDLHDADFVADLTVAADRDRVIREVDERCGGVLDVVVACAGISAGTPPVVGVNFFGAVRLLEGLRPALAAAERPRAAAVASLAGTQPADDELIAACLRDDETAALRRAQQLVDQGRSATLYPSSKSAVAQWLRHASVTPEWAGAGIPLNAVAPGVVLTPMTAPLFDDPSMKPIIDEAVPMPLNGYAEPEVIAAALRWLISSENSHTSGQVVYVDGGAEASLRGPTVF